jgi:hypothetical protein
MLRKSGLMLNEVIREFKFLLCEQQCVNAKEFQRFCVIQYFEEYAGDATRLD